MQKICTNCGTSNSEYAKFCTKCGNEFGTHESSNSGVGERTPAAQVAEMTEKAKDNANKAMEKTKQVLTGLSKNEKIIGGGALVALVSFILPWISGPGKTVNGFRAVADDWYMYYLPFSVLASLVLLYATQGAPEISKTLATRWQIVIGASCGAVGVWLTFFINALVAFRLSAEFGVYLFVAGAVAISVGGFRLQTELLKRGSS